MIYYVIEVRTKRRGYDGEYLETSRENFEDVSKHLENLHYLPFDIDEIQVKQYAYNEFSRRVALLNCFIISFPYKNIYSKPIFTLKDVSKVV